MDLIDITELCIELTHTGLVTMVQVSQQRLALRHHDARIQVVVACSTSRAVLKLPCVQEVLHRPLQHTVHLLEVL